MNAHMEINYCTWTRVIDQAEKEARIWWASFVASCRIQSVQVGPGRYSSDLTREVIKC